MIETVHLNRQRRNHRRQLEHDRAVQAAVLRGEQPPEWSTDDELEGDDVGDSFSVAGDTHVYQQPPQQPVPQSPPQQPRSGVPDMVKGGILAAALASIPAGMGLGYWLNRPQPEQTQATPQTKQDQLPPWWLSPGYRVHPPESETE